MNAEDVRRYHQALWITAICSIVLAAGLVRAYLVAPRPLTSTEILAATRQAVDDAVNAAVGRGGITDSHRFVESTIAARLRAMGFGGELVHVRRPNDLDPYAALYFIVEVHDLAMRFDLEGTRDPLLSIRLGLEVRIRADPFHPYTSHREPAVLAACVRYHFYHLAPEGPDFFARLENRTFDPYHFGFETFVTDGAQLAVDHAFLETGAWGLDDLHRQRYGL